MKGNLTFSDFAVNHPSTRRLDFLGQGAESWRLIETEGVIRRHCAIWE